MQDPGGVALDQGQPQSDARRVIVQQFRRGQLTDGRLGGGDIPEAEQRHVGLEDESQGVALFRQQAVRHLVGFLKLPSEKIRPTGIQGLPGPQKDRRGVGKVIFVL